MGDVINFLVPAHRKLEEDEVICLLEKYNISDVSKLPKISVKDAAIKAFGFEIGVVVEITRKSFAGESKYYRVVNG